MATESKVISIRTSDDVRERFQQFLDSEGARAGEMLEKLINAYDQEASMPRHQAEFDDFNAHLDDLRVKFHNAYNMLANTEERMAVQYTDKIKLLEEHNAELEGKDAECKRAIERATELEQINSDLREQNKLLKEKQDFDNSLIEKVKLADELTVQLTAANTKIAALEEKTADLERQLADEKARVNELVKSALSSYDSTTPASAKSTKAARKTTKASVRATDNS